jgi:type II secretory pathway pseudopilin PulG
MDVRTLLELLGGIIIVALAIPALLSGWFNKKD